MIIALFLLTNCNIHPRKVIIFAPKICLFPHFFALRLTIFCYICHSKPQRVMKRTILYLLLLFASSTLSQAQEIVNPITQGGWPDPTIWQGEDGRYYSICTGLRRTLVSDDLFHWEVKNQSVIDKDAWSEMRYVARHFWAPDVVTINGVRLLYITLYNSAKESSIGVLREVEPNRFEFHGVITRSTDTGIIDTIDPEVVVDERGKRVWLFFGSIGKMHRVELTRDGLGVKRGARYTHVAGLTDKENRSRSKVFEGCYLHRRNGYWYLFASAGWYKDHTYRLVVGRSRRLTGQFRDRNGNPMVEGYATPVITSEKGDHFYGPGHCGEIFTKDGRDYIFYHCHNRNVKPHQRPLMMQEIKWDKSGWPYVEGGKPR